MKLQKILLLITTLFASHSFAQHKNSVVIISDITKRYGAVPGSNVVEWKGNDTLVNYSVLRPDRHWGLSRTCIMGAEYIMGIHNEADSSGPNFDALPTNQCRFWRSVADIQGRIFKWNFYLPKPRVITNDELLGGTYLCMPGDSIYIRYVDSIPIFSGRGAKKYEVIYQLTQELKRMPRLPRDIRYPKNLTGLLELNADFNKKCALVKARLEKEKSNLPLLEYEYIKARFLGDFQASIALAYAVLPKPHPQQKEVLAYSQQDIHNVYDSLMYKPDAIWLRSDYAKNIPGNGGRGEAQSFVANELIRKLGYNSDSVQDIQIFKKLIYQTLKERYTGVFRERVLCDYIEEEVVQEMGVNSWFCRSILEDYYSTPGFPAYKEWVKGMASESQSRTNFGGFAPLFKLTDRQNKIYSKTNTTGKFTIVNFWYTGCEPCKQTARDLEKVQAQFKNDTSFQILHVSVDTDKNKWEQSIQEGIYVPKNGLHLYTGGKGRDHAMLKDFKVSVFPTIRMYDHTGVIILDRDNLDANLFSEKEMIAAIGGKTLVNFNDGPYVFHEKGKIKAINIEKGEARNVSASKLSSGTDLYQTKFPVSLKKKHEAVPSVYPAVSKMIVLSDIEGNFEPFRKLLQNNGVIDDKFNWIFGNGHLVFAGDMFDRGKQVTECLWLAYSLEEKAKAAGGMMHFVLGNHDIMNLQGDLRYVHEKYKKSAELMNKQLKDIYTENSELGRWLRTKNVMEKIGDMLFMHAGISSELYNAGLTIEQINKLAKPNYNVFPQDLKFGDEKTDIVMGVQGPFWYRGYYEDAVHESVVDSALQIFGVNRIVTGHTIIADTISVRYNGKVINTDTKHASGRSEALLIEGDRFYRVNAKGNKSLMFIDEKRNKTTSLQKTKPNS